MAAMKSQCSERWALQLSSIPLDEANNRQAFP
jgi:hypothetical protein